jgi:hypothetical protein
LAAVTLTGHLSVAFALTALGCSAQATPLASPPLITAPLPDDALTSHAKPAPSSLESRTLEEMGRLRGLPPKHPVTCARVSRPELLTLVREHIAHEVPPSAIRAEGLVQKLLGFFPTQGDYEAVIYELLEAQLAGYYEPANATMYLASDLDEENAVATLSHELVHALQDQYWDLKTRSQYVAGQDDKNGALSALAEGDATSAMEDFAASHEHPGGTALDVPDRVLVDRMTESMDTGPAANTPHALRRALLAPYVDGTPFVNAMRRRGGWASLGEVWSRAPETTEQILHPDKWRAHEPEIVLPDPLPPPSSRDLTAVAANTYGEQGLRLAFEEWMPQSSASVAASGWGGDRATLFGQGERAYALQWHVRFDDASPQPVDAFASRAFAALSVMMPRLGHVASVTGSSVCVERAGNGVLAIRRDGRDLWLAFGTVAVGPKGWTAAMSCADARAWNGEGK